MRTKRRNGLGHIWIKGPVPVLGKVRAASVARREAEVRQSRVPRTVATKTHKPVSSGQDTRITCYGLRALKFGLATPGGPVGGPQCGHWGYESVLNFFMKRNFETVGSSLLYAKRILVTKLLYTFEARN